MGIERGEGGENTGARGGRGAGLHDVDGGVSTATWAREIVLVLFYYACGKMGRWFVRSGFWYKFKFPNYKEGFVLHSHQHIRWSLKLNAIKYGAVRF